MNLFSNFAQLKPFHIFCFRLFFYSGTLAACRGPLAFLYMVNESQGFWRGCLKSLRRFRLDCSLSSSVALSRPELSSAVFTVLVHFLQYHNPYHERSHKTYEEGRQFRGIFYDFCCLECFSSYLRFEIVEPE